jgi:PBSX family phage terminase large subunit
MKQFELTPKQALVFQSTANEIGAGGAASGGKTFVNKMLAVSVAEQVPGAQIAILRNTSKNLKKNYFQGVHSMPDILSDHIKQKKVSINYTDMTITWNETGSTIHFMHCEHVETAMENLTGLEFVLIIFDEATLIHYDVMNHARTRLRVGSLKIEDPFWKARLPRLCWTSNPSGVSHNYLKQRYIDPAPPGTEFTDEYGKRILFIPFGARENPHIDYEAYEKELRSTGDPIKYARLALGDWDIGESTYFQYSFKRQYNVIPRITKLPEDWQLYRGMDHGTASPFCVLWMAVVNGQNVLTLDGRDRYFPNGSKIIFAEWYGRDSKDRAIGNRYSPSEIAKGILDREESMGLRGRIKPGPADNSMKAVLSENSVSREMEKLGVRFASSDKSKGSRVRGWEIMANMFKEGHHEKPEKPALFICENCIELITDITTLMTSPTNDADINSEMPDHAADACRYLVATPAKTYGLIPTIGL